MDRQAIQIRKQARMQCVYVGMSIYKHLEIDTGFMGEQKCQPRGCHTGRPQATTAGSGFNRKHFDQSKK